MIQLQVLIATYGKDGLDRVSCNRLPEIAGVEYLVSCQLPEGSSAIPLSLKRKDIRVIFSNSRGLSKNRNVLLHEASAPYCLIADDDLDFTPEGLETIINIFDNSPNLTVIALKYTDHEDKTEKTYPTTPFNLNHKPKGYYVSSVELAFRREPIIRKGLIFNENFGVGSTYPCGEEDLWLHDILKSGLRGEFQPVIIAMHRGKSTGIRCIGDPSVLRAQGAVISRLYRFSGFPRVILKAWRASRLSASSFIKCLVPVLKGWRDCRHHSSALFKNNQKTVKK